VGGGGLILQGNHRAANALWWPDLVGRLFFPRLLLYHGFADNGLRLGEHLLSSWEHDVPDGFAIQHHDCQKHSPRRSPSSHYNKFNHQWSGGAYLSIHAHHIFHGELICF
jgi:hypothetical protein